MFNLIQEMQVVFSLIQEMKAVFSLMQEMKAVFSFMQVGKGTVEPYAGEEPLCLAVYIFQEYLPVLYLLSLHLKKNFKFGGWGGARLIRA